jgi:hypothetical protein
MAAGHPDDEWTPRFNADPDLHWRALLRHFQPRKPLIAAGSHARRGRGGATGRRRRRWPRPSRG